MRTIRTLILIVGFFLGLAVTVDAQSGAAASAPAGGGNGAKPLILDLSSFQKEKFVTGDKTNASIYGYGEGQPGENGKTDAKGRFSFDQVCAGPIQVNANTPNGGSARKTHARPWLSRARCARECAHGRSA